jgi:hypothetical protein
MAKESNGRISGSMGTVTYYVVKGEQRIKKKAHHNTSKRTVRRKRTEAQANQLARFRLANEFASHWKNLFNISFETVGVQIGKCQAIRYLLSTAIIGTGKDLKIDLSKLIVARGSALGAAGVQVTSLPGKLEFTWEDNSGNNRNAALDDAILVACCEKYDSMCFYTLKGGERSGGRGELNVLDTPGDQYHTWISFIKKKWSCCG